VTLTPDIMIKVIYLIGKIRPLRGHNVHRPLGNSGTANPLKTKTQIKSRYKCNMSYCQIWCTALGGDPV